MVGIAITAFLLWWILRDVPFGEVWAHIRGAHWGLLMASVAVATAGFLVRALRWKVLLQPICPESTLHNRFAAVTVGFMANNILPARAGEFARAYALSRVEPVRVSGALGSLVVERILDALVLMGLLLASLWSPAFPTSAGISEGPLATALDAVLLGVMGVVLSLAVLVAFPQAVVRFAGRAADALPGKLARPVVDALEAFLGSLTVLRTPRLLLAALLWSVGFWVWHGLSFWLGMRAFDIDAGLTATYFTEAVVGFGVAIPAAPGFFGTFHASASWALSVFGVPDARSLAFAFGYHLAGFIPVTVIGLYYAARIGLSLEDVSASEEEELVGEAVERELPVVARAWEGAATPLGTAHPREARGSGCLVVPASAKVNLALHVLDPRGDGYHDLETVLQALDLQDELEVSREGWGIELAVEGENAGPVEDNLVLHAAAEFLAAAGLSAEPQPGLRFRLRKRIPSGAGLGGGSSDAAATLRALDRLFPGALAPEHMASVAARLGSDVPFFLAPSPLAIGRGRGEMLESLTTLPSLPGLVMVPGVRIETARAYRDLALHRQGMPVSSGSSRPVPTSWEELAARAANDFEAVVPPQHPSVAEALVALRATRPLLALLAGSGGACFALYRTAPEAEQARRALPSLTGSRILPIRTLAAWPEWG